MRYGRFACVSTLAAFVFCGLASAAPLTDPPAAVELSKIVVGIETGAEVGTLRGGAFCFSGPWRWRGLESPPFDEQMVPQRFEKAMVTLGYKSAPAATDLFSAQSAKSPYLLAGRIDAINMRICYPSIGFGNLYKSKGQASIKVTWQIFSQAEQKIVATISTEGTFERKSSITDGSYTILLKAFDGAIGQLVGSSQFIAIYGAAPVPVRLPEPDPILPPGETDPSKALPAKK